jgi:segregation and condensation protein B
MSAPDMTDDINLEHLRVLEALLFAAAEPLSTKMIHERMPDGSDAGALLMRLKSDYENRGVVLVGSEGHWAFRTAPDLADALQVNKEAQRKLSRAAMETLAIVSYHQPITRAEIENIRGVATHKGTLDALMEAGWVKPGRRRETPGRPLTWMTSAGFLDHFSLESLMDLPGLDDLKASGMLDRRPAIETLTQTEDLFANGDEEGDTEDYQDAAADEPLDDNMAAQ